MWRHAVAVPVEGALEALDGWPTPGYRGAGGTTWGRGTMATIGKTGSNEMTLQALDPLSGEAVARVFWVPRCGVYVREGERHLPTDPQVCAGLGHWGNTLTATDGDDLLRVIRREWAAYRQAAARLATA
jgi:hypothetical protein